jgi:hypothetical protein
MLTKSIVTDGVSPGHIKRHTFGQVQFMLGPRQAPQLHQAAPHNNPRIRKVGCCIIEHGHLLPGTYWRPMTDCNCKSAGGLPVLAHQLR